MTGYDHEKITNASEAFFEVRTSNKVFRKLDAGEIANVFAVRHHSLEQVELKDTTEADIAARPGELQRQRRPPGTGANDCYRFGGFATY